VLSLLLLSSALANTGFLPYTVNAATPINLIQNGDFETGVSPWTLTIFDPYSQGYAATVTRTSNAYAGSYAGAFTVTSYPQGSGGVSMVQSIQPPSIGNTYTLQFYYKSTTKAYPHVTCYGSSGQLARWNGPTCQATSTWTLATMTLGPIPQGTITTKIFFETVSTGTFQIDNAVVQLQSSASSTPTQTSTPAPTATPSAPIAGSPNVVVYSDSACTIKKTPITWSSIAAGKTATQTVYVKNAGTAPITLYLAVTNWTPSAASNYITITWNRQGTQLAAGQSIAATLTLTVSSSITGITNYSNTITISGTG
jgi:hypothetical protein